jgi:hypothetical protein
MTNRKPCATSGCAGSPSPNSKSRTCSACRTKALREREGRVLSVVCACGCGTTFTPAIFGTRYLNEEHCQNHVHRLRRAERRVGKTERHPNTILIWRLRDEMDAEGKAGLCIYCEEILAKHRTHICDEPECVRLYNSDWKRGRAMLKRIAREVATQEAVS